MARSAPAVNQDGTRDIEPQERPAQPALQVQAVHLRNDEDTTKAKKEHRPQVVAIHHCDGPCCGRCGKDLSAKPVSHRARTSPRGLAVPVRAGVCSVVSNLCSSYVSSVSRVVCSPLISRSSTTSASSSFEPSTYCDGRLSIPSISERNMPASVTLRPRFAGSATTRKIVSSGCSSEPRITTRNRSAASSLIEGISDCNMRPRCMPC